MFERESELQLSVLDASGFQSLCLSGCYQEVRGGDGGGAEGDLTPEAGGGRDGDVHGGVLQEDLE